MAEQAKRFDQGKAQLRWMDAWPDALAEVAKTFAYGAEKYGPYNYKKGAPFSQSYDCARRHMMKWFNGEQFDQETFERTGQKVSHLAFAAWNILRLLDESLSPAGGTVDDRPQAFLMPPGLQPVKPPPAPYEVKPHEDRFEEAPPKRYRTLGKVRMGYPGAENREFTEDDILTRYRNGDMQVRLRGYDKYDYLHLYSFEYEEINDG